MKAADLRAIEAARKSGTWDAAYDSPKSARVPEEFQMARDVNPQAGVFSQSLDGANRYAVGEEDGDAHPEDRGVCRDVRAERKNSRTTKSASTVEIDTPWPR